MTFAEIGDSDGSDVPVDDTLFTAATFEEPQFASGIAERAKDRTRAAKATPKVNHDILDFVSDEDIVAVPKNAKKASKRKPRRNPILEDDEDDLSFAFDNSSPQGQSRSAKKPKKNKRALEAYQIAASEGSITTRRTKREVTKKPVNYTPNCDPSGEPLLVLSDVVDPTPGLPTPISLSKSPGGLVEATSPRLTGQKPIGAHIKDSQSSVPSPSGGKFITDVAESSIDLEQISPSKRADLIVSTSQKNQPEECDELTEPTTAPGIVHISSEHKSQSVFERNDAVQDGSQALTEQATETKRHVRVETAERVSPEQELRVKGVRGRPSKSASKIKKENAGKAPAKSRPKHKIPDSDESDVAASDAEVKEEIQTTMPVNINPPAKGRVRSSKKVSKVPIAAPEPKTGLPDTDALASQSIPTPELEVPRLEEKEAIPLLDKLEGDAKENKAIATDQIKVEESKIVNYAAATGKSLTTKFTSGPRHRVGLSRRQRVEPLHANFVRK